MSWCYGSSGPSGTARISEDVDAVIDAFEEPINDVGDV